MERPTIRFYAQYNIYKNYCDTIKIWLEKYNSVINIKNSIRLHSKLNFPYVLEGEDVPCCKPTDYSIVIWNELFTTRESAFDQFSRLTKDIFNNTTKKTLVILFSNVEQETKTKRKLKYENKILNIIVEYIDLDDFVPEDLNYKGLDSIIEEFILNHVKINNL